MGCAMAFYYHNRSMWDNMNLVLQLIGVTLSLTHITLNIFKIRLCWLFNFAALCVWIFLYARLRMPLVMGLMVVYQILSVAGWIKWGKKEKLFTVIPNDETKWERARLLEEMLNWYAREVIKMEWGKK